MNNNNNNEIFTKEDSVDMQSFTNSNNTKITNIDTVASNYFSALRTKSIIEPPIRYDVFPELNSVPKDLEMDFSRILHKPFFVKNIPWASTATAATPLTSIAVPNDIFVSALAKIPFNASAMYRCKVSLLLQVSGTPMHQGIVLAGSMPRNYMTTGPYLSGFAYAYNSLMAAPHVFLNANEANAVVLEVPFYYNTPLNFSSFVGDGTSAPNYYSDFSTVSLYVMNRLFAPSGASSTLTISVYAMFTALEFYVPHVEPTWVTSPSMIPESLVTDLQSSATRAIDGVFRVVGKLAGDVLDSGRAAVRHFTGLHAPNYPELLNKSAIVDRQNQNAVDVPSQYEKLDPYFKYDRVLRDYNFDTKIDEMDVLEILSKPQYLGTFVVNSTDVSGVLCWSRPITPLQEPTFSTVVDEVTGQAVSVATGTTLQRTLSLMSRYWRGGIKLHIQSVMSNFHFCKLSVVRNYCPNEKQYVAYPMFSDVNNLLTEVIEFSGGGQVQTVSLPYCSVMNQLPVTMDWAMNTMQHGMYYIYLNQPLVVNGTVSPQIQFNVYLSVDKDFQLFGYSTIPLGLVSLSQPELASEEEGNDTSSLVPESQATVVVNDQKDILLSDNQNKSPGILTDHRPIESVRDWSRRMYRYVYERYSDAALTGSRNLVQFNLSDLLGSRMQEPTGMYNTLQATSTLGICRRLFHGYRGGVKVKVILTGTNAASAYFVPPGLDAPGSGGGWLKTEPTPNLPSQVGYNLIYDEMGDQMRMYNLDSPDAPVYRLAQTVAMERPNYRTSNSNIAINEANSTSANNCILEFEIPYMSPYRFIGDSRDTKGSTTSSYPSATDLGTIMVAFVPDRFYQTGSSEGEVNLEMYVSTDDTARMGYQVYAPIVAIPAVTDGTLSVMAIPYCSQIGQVTPSPSPIGVAQCYFTKFT